MYLKSYDSELSEFLVKGFSEGFKVGADFSGQSVVICKNHTSAIENPDIVTRKIQKELSKGRYKGPFSSVPFKDFVCSPLGLVAKKEPGQFRLIHDLSFPRGDSINSSIDKSFSSVSYQNIETVIGLVQAHGRHCLMAKADIEDAFRLICLNPSEYHLLGLQWQGNYYYDRCLPMGCSSSCQIFEKFSSSLQWILNELYKINGVSHLLDDFFFVGKAGSNECQFALDSFLQVCSDVGVPIKAEKTQLPTTRITIYGIEIDSDLMIARLPIDKLEKVKDLLLRYKCRKKVTLKELQSLLGLLNFACSVIIPGRAFLRRLFDLTKGQSNPHFRIKLTSEARADLHAWYEFVSHFNGKSCFLFHNWISSDTLRLYSDAAGVHGGFAAVMGSKWFVGEWSDEMRPLHITFKELFPIVLATEIWGPLLANHKILFLTDNAAVADIINKTSCKDKVIMKLVRRLVIAALKHNIFFRSKHIAGKSNVVCDLLSRFSFQEAQKITPWLDVERTVIPSPLLAL